jgi:NhaA family Na+:H+ antiporter
MAQSSQDGDQLPREPIDVLTAPFERFLHVEAAGGVVLAACTVASLALANSPLADAFIGIWKTTVGFEFGSFSTSHSLKHWISDGLMAIFFFVIGLEVKRELVVGELRDLRRAALPIAAALGGMVVPACVYLWLQPGGDAARGWGIPMATDIAFVVGCIALLGARVPPSLRVLLLSLAIADDIGAIVVIAVGYTDEIRTGPLLLGVVGLALVRVLARLGVRRTSVYIALGTFVWLGFHESGVHATLAGVLLGLMTPARAYVAEGTLTRMLERAAVVFEGEGWRERGRAAALRRFQRATSETISPLEKLESVLHPWMGFVIIPLFALANAAVPFEASALTDPIAVAVAAGLLVGKPAGILVFSWLAIRVGLARLPEGVGWGALAGGGCLAGIGFTMALFIAGLALQGDALHSAKVGILVGSALSGLVGVALLLWSLPPAGETRDVA